jgi:hypothetical protein
MRMKVLASASLFLVFCRFCSAQSADALYLAEQIKQATERLERANRDAEYWRSQEATRKERIAALKNPDGSFNDERFKAWLDEMRHEDELRWQHLQDYTKAMLELFRSK